MGKSVQYSRRFLLASLLSSVAGRALANAPLSSMRPKPRASGYQPRQATPVEDVISASGLTGKVGFVVADAKTGKILESRNPVLSLPPASVTKSVTALYALDALGSAHQFRTRLIADGSISNGRLRGNLILSGGGDPTLDTDGLGLSNR